MLQEPCWSLCSDKSRQLHLSGPLHFPVKGKSQLFYSKPSHLLAGCFSPEGVHFRGYIISQIFLIVVTACLGLRWISFSSWNHMLWIYGMIGNGNIQACGVTAPALRYNLEIGVGHHTMIKSTQGLKWSPCNIGWKIREDSTDRAVSTANARTHRGWFPQALHLVADPLAPAEAFPWFWHL